MALTSWKGAVVRKQDIYISKNYLTADEIDSLNRFIVVFFETAELRAKNRTDLTIDFWKQNVDRILEFNDKQVLKHAGSISNAEMERRVKAIYEQFDVKRKTQEAKDADLKDLEELKYIEEEIKLKAK